MSVIENIIEQYYAAFNRQDWQAMLHCLSEDVVHDLNQGERETGKAAFTLFLERMDRCYQEQLKDIRILFSDTHAAAEYVVHGVYKATDGDFLIATGQRYVLPGGAFFDVRDGKITRVSNYYNLQDWLKQVGG